MDKTKKQEIEYFNENIRPTSGKSRFTGKETKISVEDAWNSYVDSLLDDKLITEKQNTDWKKDIPKFEIKGE